MRIVKINIYSAKIPDTSVKMFKTDNKAGMKTLGDNGLPETRLSDMDNLVHKNHISNMLHVLFGDRPVSSRNPLHSRSGYIDEITDKALLKIYNTTSVETTFKTGNTVRMFVNDQVNGRKAYSNSNMKGLVTTASNGEVFKSAFQWHIFERKSLTSERYGKVLDIMMDFGRFLGSDNPRRDYTAIDLLVKMRDYPDFANRMKEIGNIAPIVAVLDKNYESGTGLAHCTNKDYVHLCNTSYLQYKVCINGQIIVFLPDNDAYKLLWGPRVASFLDGGVAKLDGNPKSLKDLEYIDDELVPSRILDYTLDGFIETKDLPFTKFEN